MATRTDAFGDEWTESDFDDHIPAAYRRQLTSHPNPADPDYPHIEDESTDDPEAVTNSDDLDCQDVGVSTVVYS